MLKVLLDSLPAPIKDHRVVLGPRNAKSFRMWLTIISGEKPGVFLLGSVLVGVKHLISCIISSAAVRNCTGTSCRALGTSIV